MNAIKVFESVEFGRIRTIERDGEPWFVAADVCKALEIVQNRNAVARLDEDEKDVCSVDTPGGNQEMSIINEPGLYSLVLSSRKPQAKDFKRWITHEVIPSIRKRGVYATPQTTEAILQNPDVMIQLLQELKRERRARMHLEAIAEIDAPKIRFAEAVQKSRNSILIGTLAKLIQQSGVKMGERKLFEKMRKDGYLCSSGERYNLPTQQSIDKGLFEISERVIWVGGKPETRFTTKVTGKGQIYFMERYGATL